MKTRLISLILAAFVAFSATAALADIYVIANSGTSLSASEIKDVFLGSKQFSGSVKLAPVDNGAIQEEFLSKVLKFDVNKYNASWTKKSFRDGLNPPPSKSGDGEVLDFVRKTPGAVGYVRSNPGSSVSVIKKF